jgi:hypothetical protein
MLLYAFIVMKKGYLDKRVLQLQLQSFLLSALAMTCYLLVSTSRGEVSNFVFVFAIKGWKRGQFCLRVLQRGGPQPPALCAGRQRTA